MPTNFISAPIGIGSEFLVSPWTSSWATYGGSDFVIVYQQINDTLVYLQNVSFNGTEITTSTARLISMVDSEKRVFAFGDVVIVFYFIGNKIDIQFVKNTPDGLVESPIQEDFLVDLDFNKNTFRLEKISENTLRGIFNSRDLTESFVYFMEIDFENEVINNLFFREIDLVKTTFQELPPTEDGGKLFYEAFEYSDGRRVARVIDEGTSVVETFSTSTAPDTIFGTIISDNEVAQVSIDLGTTDIVVWSDDNIDVSRSTSNTVNSVDTLLHLERRYLMPICEETEKLSFMIIGENYAQPFSDIPSGREFNMGEYQGGPFEYFSSANIHQPYIYRLDKYNYMYWMFHNNKIGFKVIKV